MIDYVICVQRREITGGSFYFEPDALGGLFVGVVFVEEKNPLEVRTCCVWATKLGCDESVSAPLDINLAPRSLLVSLVTRVGHRAWNP